MNNFRFNLDELITNDVKIYTLDEISEIISNVDDDPISRFFYLYKNINMIGGIEAFNNMNIYSIEGVPKRAFISQSGDSLFMLIPFKYNQFDFNIHYILFEYDQEINYLYINLHAYYYNRLINGYNVNLSIGSIYDINNNNQIDTYIGSLELTNTFKAKENIIKSGLKYSYNTKEIINTLHFIALIFRIDYLFVRDEALHYCNNGDKILISFINKLGGKNYYYEDFGYKKNPEKQYLFNIIEELIKIIRNTPMNNYLSYMKLDILPQNPTVGEYYKEFLNQLEVNKYFNSDFGCEHMAKITNIIYNLKFIPQSWGPETLWFDEHIDYLHNLSNKDMFYYQFN